MRLPFLRQSPAITAPPDEIGGVAVHVSARARRMALRTQARTGRIVLVLPRRKAWTARMQQAAESFVAAHREWIARHDRPVEKTVLAPGARIDLLDNKYLLCHQPGRGVARIDGDAIIITGAAEHFTRRTRDFLKRHAASVLPGRVQDKARLAGVQVRDVRLRDPVSRWGSCGVDGDIMLSWRLILLPEFVMDYIVAHEVAHRVHMDHSRAFWRLCLSLTPRGAEARRWLRLNGQEAMRI